jgi:uncharacterized protein
MSLPHLLNPSHVNLRHFCRDELSQTAALPLSALPRLRDSLFNPPADLMFHLAAVGQAGRDALLALTVTGTAPLQCQRCMDTVMVSIHSTARFALVKDEEAADAMDQANREDEDAPEPLVLTPTTDMLTLAEDELLLCLPIVPMHEVCPKPLYTPPHAEQAAQEAQEASPKAHPFAALAALKTKQ